MRNSTVISNIRVKSLPLGYNIKQAKPYQLNISKDPAMLS